MSSNKKLLSLVKLVKLLFVSCIQKCYPSKNFRGSAPASLGVSTPPRPPPAKHLLSPLATPLDIDETLQPETRATLNGSRTWRMEVMPWGAKDIYYGPAQEKRGNVIFSKMTFLAFLRELVLRSTAKKTEWKKFQHSGKLQFFKETTNSAN